MSIPAHLAIHIAGGAISPLIHKGLKGWEVVTNRQLPYEMLGPEPIIEMANRRLIDRPSSDDWLLNWGIGSDEGGKFGGWAQQWNLYREAARERPTLDEILEWRRKDVITADRFNELLTTVTTRSETNLREWLAAQFETLTLEEAWRLILRTGMAPAGMEQYFRRFGYGPDDGQSWIKANREIPSFGESIELWRRKVLTDNGLLERLKWLNYDEDNAKDLFRVAKPLLGEEQIIALWRRKEWPEVRADNELSYHGWNDEEVEKIKKLSEEVPPITDIIRYMVRNVYDEDIVKAFDLDAEFEQKFRGDLPDWAFADGLGDKQVKAEWRAHWQIPAPTQLYEMVRRLRPEKYANVPAGDAGNLTVTMKDVDRALGENDVLPFWRKRLVAISYNPLGRIDLRRGFNIGVFDEPELLERYQDIGYNEADSRKQVKLAIVLRLKALDSHQAVKQYQAGTATSEEAIGYMQAEGLPAEVSQQALDRAKQRMHWDTRRTCLPQLRKRYMLGEWDRAGAIGQLTGLGLDPVQANEIAGRWDCQRSAIARQIPAGQLCQWYIDGLLSVQEYSTRLARLGYRPDDVGRILRECQGKATQKLEAAQKRAESYAKAVKKERDKARGELQRALAKRLKLAEKTAETWGVSTNQVQTAMDDAIAGLMQRHGLDIDRARIISLAMLDAGTVKTAEEYPERVEAAYQAEQELEKEAAATPAEG